MCSHISLYLLSSSFFFMCALELGDSLQVNSHAEEEKVSGGCERKRWELREAANYDSSGKKVCACRTDSRGNNIGGICCDFGSQSRREKLKVKTVKRRPALAPARTQSLSRPRQFPHGRPSRVLKIITAPSVCRDLGIYMCTFMMFKGKTDAKGLKAKSDPPPGGLM